MTPKQLAFALPLVFTIHNAEEASTIAVFLPAAKARLSVFAPTWAHELSAARFVTALTFVTILGVVVGLWAFYRPTSFAARWALLLLQAVLLLNAFSHVVSAFVLRGYSPGLASATLLNLPLSLYVFRTATKERWLPRTAFLALIPAAVVVHGPLLIGLLALFATIRAA